VSGSESRFYRDRPGAGWLFVAVTVPLLLALIGWAGSGAQRGAPTVPSVVASASLTPAPEPVPTTTSQAPTGPFGAFSIVRSGKGFQIGGQMPDAAEKQSLIDTLNLAMPGATVTDQLQVVPGVRAPDFGSLGGVFSTAPEITDFALRLADGTLTLTGTATKPDRRAAAESAAAQAWPNVKIVNDIRVSP
jgi:peptidoglycan-binding protein ArfA